MKRQISTQIKFESMSDVLNFIRRKLNLTQVQLAIRLETSQNSVTDWETKKCTPMFAAKRIKLLLSLMNEAGLSASDLPDEK